MVCLIGLSRLALTFCVRGFCFCSCTQDKFVIASAPGHSPSLCFGGQNSHLPAIIIQYTLTVFSFDQLCTAILIQYLQPNILNGNKFAVPKKLKSNILYAQLNLFSECKKTQYLPSSITA
jgi:hypothetical protein